MSIETRFRLIPEPKSMLEFGGTLTAKSPYLSEELLAYIGKVATSLFPEAGQTPIAFTPNATLESEAYILTVSKDGITVAASAPAGAYYALTTLSQLKVLYGESLPCLKIEDVPSLKTRSYMDAMDAEVPTAAQLKDFILRLSHLKYNSYMPYIERSFPFDSVPAMGKYNNKISKEEWREVVDFAKECFVEIVPIFETLSHWWVSLGTRDFYDIALLATDSPKFDNESQNNYYRALRHAGTIGIELDPKNPRSMELTKLMLDELVDIFGTKLHIGLDESDGLVAHYGREEAVRVFNGWIMELHKHLAPRGVTLYLWEDMYDTNWGYYGLGIDSVLELPDDIVFVFWDYTPRPYYEKLDNIKKRKPHVIFAPATHNWDSILPMTEFCYDNTRTLALQSDGTDGMLMTAWQGLYGLREAHWAGIQIGAHFSWNTHSDISYEETIRSYFFFTFGIEDLDFERFLDLYRFDRVAASAKKPEFLDDGSVSPEWLHIREIEAGKVITSLTGDLANEQDLHYRAAIEKTAPAFLAAADHFFALKPTRNQLLFDIFLMQLKAACCAHRKALVCPHYFKTHEDAIETIPAVEALMQEIDEIRKEHIRLLDATGRAINRDALNARYDTIIDKMRIFTRYCRFSTRFDYTKHY